MKDDKTNETPQEKPRTYSEKELTKALKEQKDAIKTAVKQHNGETVTKYTILQTIDKV